MRLCAGTVLLVGLAVALGPSPSFAGQGIAFEDVTAKCGISWESLPRDKADIKPGVPYCGWQSDAFLCDLDGDGHLDLISPVHHSSQATPGGIWSSRGDGTFGPNLMDKYPVHDEKGVKAWVYCMYGVGVDMNGDGKLDFYVTEPGACYLNEGVEGTGETRLVKFLRCQTATGGSRTCIFGDFNRDGNLDLACAARLFVGGGKGTSPQDWKLHPQATELFRQWNAATQYGAFHQGVSADFDRDGSVDLLINPSLLGKGKAEPRPRTLLYLNDGKGNFAERAEALGVAGGPPQGPLVAADLNNDGYFDIIVAGRGNGIEDLTRKVMLYANEGGRKFTAKEGEECGLKISQTADYNIVYCSAIAVDIDNDGLLDVVLGDALKGYRVLHNLGHFQFGEIAVLPPGARFARPATADLNEDGLTDLILNEGKVGFTIYLNRTKNANGWLDVAVKGTEGNTCGVGSLVEVFKAGRLGDRSACVGMQHVTAENDNHVPLAPHFGLGREAAVDVRVTLPTGEMLEARGVNAKSRVLADFVAQKIGETN